MEKKLIRRIIMGMIIFIAVAVLAQLLYYANVYLEKMSNKQKVVDYVDVNLMYRWETMDEDLDYINNWIDRGHFYNEDIGRLYERASLIYMQKGEIMPYYKYLGYAIYYLERSPEKDYTVNVYLDLANFFLNNYVDDSAKKMVDAALKIEDFDDIQNLQVKSYAFRMLGIMSILNEEYDKAEEYLNKAQEILEISNSGIFEESYEAIDDAWLARVYVETGRYDECQAKLEKWEGHQLFSQDIYREILLRDFIIPYYQVKCMCSTALIYEGSTGLGEDELKEKEQEVGAVYNEFMEICEENGYKKTELYTMLKLQNEYPPLTDEARIPMISNLYRLYTELFDEQNGDYANFIDSTVLDSISEMEQYELEERETVRRRQITIVTVIVAFVVLDILVIFLLNSRLDGLTGLLNRRAFNRALARIKKRDNIYGIIMMDIDNFKSVNDTYGHQNGDIVLERLGEIIRSENNSDVRGYRYGGEEVVILLDKKALIYSQTIAERIRSTLGRQKWPFDENIVITISGGIAMGSGDDDVLKKADENLYRAKENGRNQIAVSSE